MFCANCGKEQEGNPAYCTNCGVRLGADPAVQPNIVSALEVKYAGFWIRLVAFFIDVILLFLVNILLGYFLVGIFAGLWIGVVINWLYFTLMESSSNQATLGKMALGLIVTDGAGRSISFGRATGRYFGKFLTWWIFVPVFIVIAFTRKKQGLHDMLVDTLVISK